MNFLFAALIVNVGIISAISAPSSSIDANILRQNAANAQILNSEFQSLRATDPCDSGLMACVEGALARCTFGSWQLQPCLDSQQCFALPSVNSTGTILTCTSQAHALSVLTAAGTTGGLTDDCTNRTVAFPTQSVPSAPSTSPSSSASGTSSVAATASSASGVEVVTVTVTLPLTLPPSTTTLQPQEAFSILASLSAQGFSITTLPLSSAPPLPSGSTTSSSTPILVSPTISTPTFPIPVSSSASVSTEEPSITASISSEAVAAESAGSSTPYRRAYRDRRAFV
ncbi:hypothetical protein NM688_g7209 [Phlebia brevispora]|uniref:Uncharacterized protein n=1 Tax=Phlebia brevispora TaxID=194682 RepID=A0ACC1S7Y7_9APHY|nr:hypothetical protein NM688_g7209 [Phlebia brevispora]